MLFWYLKISWRATVPSQYLWGFFMRPFCLNSLQGAFPLSVGLTQPESQSWRLVRPQPLMPAALVAGLVVTSPPLQASSPLLLSFTCKGGVPHMATPSWGPSPSPPQGYFCLSHSEMEKQPIRDIGEVFSRLHVVFSFLESNS